MTDAEWDAVANRYISHYNNLGDMMSMGYNESEAKQLLEIINA